MRQKLLVCIVLVVMGSPLLAKTAALGSLITADGKPSPALLKLSARLGVKHDGSLKGLCEATQKTWLRKDDVARLDIKATLKHSLAELRPLLEELGLLSAVRPQQKTFRYAVIMGGYIGTMATRLNYLLQLVGAGYQFEQLVFLVGDRDAHTTEDRLNKLPGAFSYSLNRDLLPKNETDAAELLWVLTPKPAVLAGKTISFVDTPKSAKGYRPTTASTFAKFAEDFRLFDQKPSPQQDALVLFVTTQPFVEYMSRTVAGLAKGRVTFAFAGPQVSEADLARDNAVEIILDSITRTLYTATH